MTVYFLLWDSASGILYIMDIPGPYLDLSSVEEESGTEGDTQIAAFTRKGNSLADTLEEYLEELKEDGSLSQLSTKYFGEDLTI